MRGEITVQIETVQAGESTRQTNVNIWQQEIRTLQQPGAMGLDTCKMDVQLNRLLSLLSITMLHQLQRP